jgi:molybdopterin biosynthesis enzyme MoaB
MCVLWVRLPEQLSDINDRDIEGIMYIRCNSTSQFQKSFVLNATVAYVISIIIQMVFVTPKFWSE